MSAKIHTHNCTAFLLAITDPGQDIEEFVRHYDETYGSEHPTFFRVSYKSQFGTGAKNVVNLMYCFLFQGSYNQALQEARKELKFLLAYLHCDDHIDTRPFCTRVMADEGFRDFIRENMVFWGCSVSKPEGYRTSQALRENTYPFLAVIVLKNNKMTVVKRLVI